MANKDFVTGEDCPQGENCAIHFRVDEKFLDEDYKTGRIITYVGNCVVITEENLNLPAALPASIIQLLGFNAYETSVTEVGDDALAGLYVRAAEEEGLISEMTRFIQEHDSWEHFESAHEMVVNGVRNGTIDLSTSALKAEA